MSALVFSNLELVANQSPSAQIVFQNREREIKAMTRIILSNFVAARDVKDKGPGSESQYPLVLLTAAQMMGSGKSTLGVNFLPQIASPRFKDLIEECTALFGHDCVQKLLDLSPVFINFRAGNQTLDVILNTRVLLVKAFLSLCSGEPRTKAIEQFTNKPVAHISSLKIVQYFTHLCGGKRFFLHFDEFDAW